METEFLQRVEPAAPSYADPVVFGPVDIIEAHAVKFLPNHGELPSGSPINAMFETELPRSIDLNTVLHWRFDFRGGPATGSVGLTLPNRFGLGWSAKGIYQLPGGNLAGNAGLIKSRWAKSYSTPAVVDWYMERVGETDLVIYSVVNGEVQQSTATVKFTSPDVINKIKPMVKFDVPSGTSVGGSMCTVRVYQPVPIGQALAISYRNAVPVSSAAGDWVFENPLYNGAKVHIESSGSITARVVNILRPRITLQNLDQNQGSVEFAPDGLCVSTLMAPLGDLARVEQLVKSVWFHNPGSSWRLESKGNGLIIGEHKFARVLPDRTIEISAASLELL